MGYFEANIGTYINGEPGNTLSDVLAAVARACALAPVGFIKAAYTEKGPTGEPTVAVRLYGEANYVGDVAKRLCTDLQQEAIAVWHEAIAEGFLVGPKAEAWGPFDPALFVTVNEIKARGF